MNSDLYYVDPETGELKDVSKGSSSGLATWWSVDSSALLASTATSSPSPATSTSDVIPTSATSKTISDMTATYTSAAVHPSASSCTPTTVGSPPSSLAQSTSQPPSSDGIPAGAGVGIGISCGVIVVGVAALIWLLLRKRKKRRLLEVHKGTYGYNGQSMIYASSYRGFSSLPGYENGRLHEVEGRERYEMN